jgi:hypothetical protein
MRPKDVLELFNANYRTEIAALNGNESRVRHNDMRSIEGKAKKLATEKTLGQVGVNNWQRFTGATGRGWRYPPARR